MSRIVLDPDQRAPGRRARRCCLGPTSLDGRTIGLLDISKPRGNIFLDRLEERSTSAGARVERYKKPTFTKPAPVDLRHEIATQCDARDRGPRRLRELHVVQCARHRRSRSAGACPSVFVASAEFVQAADAQAASLGFPTVARVFTPHPIQDRTDDEMRAYADAAYDEILAKLTATPN